MGVNRALVAQRIEHRSSEPRVGGSNPSERATISNLNWRLRALIELGAAWESALTGEMKWVRDAYAPVRHGRTVVYRLGLTGIPVYNVNNNCSTGSTALFMGKQLHCSARSASST